MTGISAALDLLIIRDVDGGIQADSWPEHTEFSDVIVQRCLDESEERSRWGLRVAHDRSGLIVETVNAAGVYVLTPLANRRSYQGDLVALLRWEEK